MHKWIIGFLVSTLIIGIHLMPSALSAHEPVKQSGETETQVYPPYPDVWDWVLPDIYKGTDTLIHVQVREMPNGDVLIYWPDKGKCKITSFFQQSVAREAARCPDIPIDRRERTSFAFQHDSILRRTGGGWRSGGCYDALDYNVNIYDKFYKNLLDSRLLLYILDKPARYETHPHCMNGPSFDYQVQAVPASFVPLKDRTFLLIARVNDNYYIIRFDENFETKSRLMNDRFFWMETEKFEKFDTRYGDRSEEDKRLKDLYTDLYKQLIEIRNRRMTK